MSNTESNARLKALAEYFRNGGSDPNAAKMAMGQPDSTGDISAAPRQPLAKPQNVPEWALHTASQPETQSGVGSLDDMALARAAQLKQNNLATQDPSSAPDLSGYQPYVAPKPGPRQFPAIRQTISPKNSTLDQDIENSTSPTKALSPDQEAQLNQKMQDDDEDDEKKQFAANNNNRSGSAEGSYGP